MLVNLYDKISDQAGYPQTTGGTWTFVGTASSYPAPPSPYDDDIDFTGYAGGADGTYVYRYTITSGSCSLSSDYVVQWYGASAAPTNDTCAGAAQIVGLICPGQVSYDDQNEGSCELNVPTVSGVSLPASWVNTYGGDLWYRIDPLICESNYTLVVTVEATDTAFKGPGLEVLQSPCGALTSLGDAAANINGTQTQVQIGVPANEAVTYYIRVASVSAGNFRIFIDCNNACTPGVDQDNNFYDSDADAAANGVSLYEVYYLSATNIYGQPFGAPKKRTT